MVDFNIATGATQPINRTGIENNQVAGSDVQGTAVGVDNSGTVPQLVAADADSATAIPALGVLFPQEVVDYSTIPTGNYFQDLEEQLVQENKTLKGDRATVIFGGIEMVNDDDDTTWNPGDLVYLAPGGGFTTTKPSATGDLVQVVGVVLTPDGTGKDRFLLDVNFDYATA